MEYFFYFCEWNLFAREIENIRANQASRAISLVSNCPTSILFCLRPKVIFCENARTWSLELLKWMAVFLSCQHLMARCHKQRSIFYLLDRFQFLFNFSFKLLHGAILAVLIILNHALFLGWCTFTCVLLKQSWCCWWSRVTRTCRDGAPWYAIIHISALFFFLFLWLFASFLRLFLPIFSCRAPQFLQVSRWWNSDHPRISLVSIAGNQWWDRKECHNETNGCSWWVHPWSCEAAW